MPNFEQQFIVVNCRALEDASHRCQALFALKRTGVQLLRLTVRSLAVADMFD
jgi:hypothetical protein